MEHSLGDIFVLHTTQACMQGLRKQSTKWANGGKVGALLKGTLTLHTLQFHRFTVINSVHNHFVCRTYQNKHLINRFRKLCIRILERDFIDNQYFVYGSGTLCIWYLELHIKMMETDDNAK